MAASAAGARAAVRLRRGREREFADYHDPDRMGFGPLRLMVENHIQSRPGFPAYPHRDV